MSDWQPIETAPRDTTEVLVASGLHVTTAQWSDESGGWIYSQEGEPVFDGDELEPSWIIDQPTHWMFLPQPPSAEPEYPDGPMGDLIRSVDKLRADEFAAYLTEMNNRAGTN